MIQDLRLTVISEIARYVPGLSVIDRGPRDEVPDILVRGLNTSDLGPGFIDYNFVVRASGVSDPEPDFSNPDEVRANLRQVEDANGAETFAARVNLRWTPNDWLDANLWYLYR